MKETWKSLWTRLFLDSSKDNIAFKDFYIYQEILSY